MREFLLAATAMSPIAGCGETMSVEDKMLAEMKADSLGMKRNELIRQVLYGVAFREELAAA